MLRKSLAFRGNNSKKNNSKHTKDLLNILSELKSDCSPHQNYKKPTIKHALHFSDLKSKEQNAINEKQRKKSGFCDNYVASLALAVADREIRINRNIPKKLLALSRDNIIEHAARRVDLFFYTLIAYYKTHCLPIQGDTLFQHGHGRKTIKRVELTQACHSSFFPSFVDKVIHSQIKVDSPAADKANIDFKRSILSGTHFLDSLNSTVELPLFVNNFDCHLEGKIENPSACRQKALEIIRKVSAGHVNPIEGLREFFLIMKQAFADIAGKKPMSKYGNPYLERDSLNSPLDIKDELIELEKIGTFKSKWCEGVQDVSQEYIELLLRLTPEEKTLSMRSLSKRKKIYLDKMNEIQLEILTTKSSYGYSA